MWQGVKEWVLEVLHEKQKTKRETKKRTSPGSQVKEVFLWGENKGPPVSGTVNNSNNLRARKEESWVTFASTGKAGCWEESQIKGGRLKR